MKPRQRILEVLGHVGYPLPGSLIAGICGLWSGRFYVEIYRLEREGIVSSAWEETSFPRRRLYRIKRVESKT